MLSQPKITIAGASVLYAGDGLLILRLDPERTRVRGGELADLNDPGVYPEFGDETTVIIQRYAEPLRSAAIPPEINRHREARPFA